MKMDLPAFGRRLLLPSTSFAIVFLLHYCWIAFFPETDPAQNQWVPLPVETSSLQHYLDTDRYWMGYSYGLCFAFAIVAWRKYPKKTCGGSRIQVISGVSFPGFLAAAGCFLTGCCGSPMLAVWLSLFGVSFLPFAKPLVAIMTTLTVGLTWFWMDKKRTPCEKRPK